MGEIVQGLDPSTDAHILRHKDYRPMNKSFGPMLDTCRPMTKFWHRLVSSTDNVRKHEMVGPCRERIGDLSSRAM